MADLWPLVASASLLKLLLVPAYHSTDFEVHRNWLAITHSLPVNKWYIDDTSEWTLDYPPLFAWFEWVLSHFAKLFDPDMLVVTNLNYASQATILFQRLSVIFTDFIYIYAIIEFTNVPDELMSSKSNKNNRFSKLIISVLLIFNFGLFIVDHIHFQYNGMLFGFLLLSITRILQEKHMEGAFWFSILLNMKHIFLYFAPAYFIYLLRSHCFKALKPVSFRQFSVWNFLNLGSVVGFVSMFSIGPFLYMQQGSQLLSRLFPFKRGLVHAYWAPNFWAIYSGLDKVLTFLFVGVGFISKDSVPQASMTGGMVQEYKHIVLPSIPPIVTLFLTVSFMIPNFVFLWVKPSKIAFLRSLILCGFSSYIFGWHVHEKAILMIIIPMTLLTLYSYEDCKIFLLLSTTGFYSLLPLIFSPLENILKVLMLLCSCHISFEMLDSFYGPRTSFFILPILDKWESCYLIGLIPLGLFNNLGFWLLRLEQRLPFLPLMLTSLYCSVGIIYCYLRLYRLFYKESYNKGNGYLWAGSPEQNKTKSEKKSS